MTEDVHTASATHARAGMAMLVRAVSFFLYRRLIKFAVLVFIVAIHTVLRGTIVNRTYVIHKKR